MKKTIYLLALVLATQSIALAEGGRETDGGDAIRIAQQAYRVSIENFIRLHLKKELISLIDFVQSGEISDKTTRDHFNKMLKMNLKTDIQESTYVIQTSCIDKNGESKDATAVRGDFGGEICFSVDQLAKNFVSSENIVGLALHEHAHHFGIEDQDHAIGAFFAVQYVEKLKLAENSETHKKGLSLPDLWWSSENNARHHTTLALVTLGVMDSKKEQMSKIYKDPSLFKMNRISQWGQGRQGLTLFAHSFLGLLDTFRWKYKDGATRDTVSDEIVDLFFSEGKNVKDLARVVYENMDQSDHYLTTAEGKIISDTKAGIMDRLCKNGKSTAQDVTREIDSLFDRAGSDQYPQALRTGYLNLGKELRKKWIQGGSEAFCK